MRRPIFCPTKRKTNILRFLGDFRNLNGQIKCETYPMPEINNVLLKQEGFKYATPILFKYGILLYKTQKGC